LDADEHPTPGVGPAVASGKGRWYLASVTTAGVKGENAMANPRHPATTITVGPGGADVCGCTGRAIQIALDAVAFRGGGTVQVAAGEYELLDAVRLRPYTRLIGDRRGTVLRRRGPVAWSELACDADVGQDQITPTRPERFAPGMGVLTWDERLGWNAGNLVTVTDIRDGMLHLHDYLTADRLAEDAGRVVNHYPMVLGYESPNVHVEGFTIDAAVDDPDGAVGPLRTAAVYLYRCPDACLRGLTVRGSPGDGICFGKTSVRTVVEDCEAAHNGCHGIHPGSHSAHSAVRRCHIHHNGFDGLYVCWGIHHSELVDNDIHDNGLVGLRSGISIGHKDTDNLIARNRIYRNRKYGVCFRAKTAANGAHRNTLRGNVIEDNGSEADELAEVKAALEPWESIGCGLHVSPVTRDLVLEDNVLRETRRAERRRQRYGVWLAEGVSNVTLRGNTIEGHPDGDLRDDARAVVPPEPAGA